MTEFWQDSARSFSSRDEPETSSVHVVDEIKISHFILVNVHMCSYTAKAKKCSSGILHKHMSGKWREGILIH